MKNPQIATMALKTIRRKLHPGDADGRRNEDLDPPKPSGNCEARLEDYIDFGYYKATVVHSSKRSNKLSKVDPCHSISCLTSCLFFKGMQREKQRLFG